MIAAMRAGEAAVGDKRCRQPAAPRIHGDTESSALDLRVDDHANLLGGRHRLACVSYERWLHLRKFLPTSGSPAGITDRGAIDVSLSRANAGIN